MAKKLYPESAVQAIANAIRAKNGSSETYTIGEMAQAIEDIPSGDDVFKAGTIGTTFNGYKDIGEVHVPDSVTSIGTSAFQNCTGLASIDLPDSLTSIGQNAFYGCSSLASIDIPDSVTSIGTSAFQNCSSLVSIDLPDSVTSIKNNTFQNCTGLESIDLPDSLTSIDQYAFSGCPKLVSIDIPDSVTSIGTSAFANCSKLTSITCRATIPPTIQANTLTSVPSRASIYVPAESVEAYKAAANWSARADYIKAIPSEG